MSWRRPRLSLRSETWSGWSKITDLVSCGVTNLTPRPRIRASRVAPVLVLFRVN